MRRPLEPWENLSANVHHWSTFLGGCHCSSFSRSADFLLCSPSLLFFCWFSFFIYIISLYMLDMTITWGRICWSVNSHCCIIVPFIWSSIALKLKVGLHQFSYSITCFIYYHTKPFSCYYFILLWTNIDNHQVFAPTVLPHGRLLYCWVSTVATALWFIQFSPNIQLAL